MQTTKMTVKVYEKLLVSFDKDVKRCFLKRDAYLNSMIRVETEHLEEDLKGRRSSNVARRHIAGELKRLGTRTVNLVVDKAVATRLDRVVVRHNLVRDAFINRLMALLRSSEALLGYLDLPERIESSSFNGFVPGLPTGPLAAIAETESDPLFYLRVACQERFGVGLYVVPFPRQLRGLSCYMDDDELPTSNVSKTKKKQDEELIGALEAFESSAFAKKLKPIEVRK